jgi:hypothetical protein
MKMKWGALVVDGRNKIGGHVASANRSGAYLRTKVTPVNPRSSFQVAVRARLASISSAWRGLTSAQITAWNAAVSDYKKTDIFGDLQNPSGFNLFQRLNNNLVNIGVAQITTPPAPTSVSVFASASLAAAAGAQTMIATVSPATLPANESVIVRATPAVSNGKTFVKSEFRQTEVIATIVAGSVNLAAAYIAKFGPIGAAGEKIFVEFIHVNETTGQTSQPQQVHTTIAA